MKLAVTRAILLMCVVSMYGTAAANDIADLDALVRRVEALEQKLSNAGIQGWLVNDRQPFHNAFHVFGISNSFPPLDIGVQGELEMAKSCRPLSLRHWLIPSCD